MAKGRFTSAQAYRDYQARLAREALLPLLDAAGIRLAGMSLLDVGCGTGGMTTAWAALGARAVGVDIDAGRLAGLEGFTGSGADGEAGETAIHGAEAGDACGAGACRFLVGDATRLPLETGSFDLVFAHDCIEHVPDVPAALGEIARVLAPSGTAFVTFPPFYSFYGGHQQGSGTVARFFPYGHLLPRRAWLAVAGGDAYARMFDGLARLSVGRFEREAAAAGLCAQRKHAYILRPEAALRMGVAPVGAGFLASLPLVRELAVGGAFYFLRKAGHAAPASG